jgi:predicted AlkP superfamily phosphohydrolase/phosphomutase
VAATVGTPPTLAIAFDAAEPALLRKLMAGGDMPVLAALAAGGATARVTSPAHLGSGTVWPTFGSARLPLAHGTYYQWRWDPARMKVVSEHDHSTVPWWRAVAQRGRRVLTLDVPFMRLAEVDGCVEIAEWGAHDRARGIVRARPASLVDELARDPGPHPFQREPAPPPDKLSLRDLRTVSSNAQTGAKLRGELAVRLLSELRPDIACIVFPELHHASHLLWQAVAPDDPLLVDRRAPRLDDRALIDVFRAADSALGRIVESQPPGVRVVVFSLHGMRPTRGVPTVLAPLLGHLGYAARRRMQRISPGDAGRIAFAAAKARAPNVARRAWRRTAGPALLRAAAAQTTLPPLDWDRTRAIALPSDQHGWVRINLAGREARGIVPATHYAGTCEELTAALLMARTDDGRPLVAKVVSVAGENGGRPPARLPDLVVHWEDAAHDVPVHVAGSDIVAKPDGLRLTGQHTFDGLLVASGVEPPGDAIAAHDLHRLVAP